MRVVIVEDEGAAARNLERQLRSLEPKLQVLAHLASVGEAVAKLPLLESPDLVFLDVELGDGLGFDIAEQLSLTHPVIFTTAYDNYALRAFEVDSVDYLLKPIRKERLALALERFRQRRIRPLDPQLVRSLRQALTEEPAEDRFLVRRGSRLYSIPVQRIAYCYRDGLVRLITHDDERYLLDQSLDGLESRLGQQFLRLDRRFVASLDAVREVQVLARSRLQVLLHPAPPFPPVVSPERAALVKRWLGR